MSRPRVARRNDARVTPRCRRNAPHCLHGRRCSGYSCGRSRGLYALCFSLWMTAIGHRRHEGMTYLSLEHQDMLLCPNWSTAKSRIPFSLLCPHYITLLCPWLCSASLSALLYIPHTTPRYSALLRATPRFSTLRCATLRSYDTLCKTWATS